MRLRSFVLALAFASLPRVALAEPWAAQAEEIAGPHLELRLEDPVAIRSLHDGQAFAAVTVLGFSASAAHRGLAAPALLFPLGRRSGELALRLLVVDGLGRLYRRRLTLHGWLHGTAPEACCASTAAIALGGAAKVAADARSRSDVAMADAPEFLPSLVLTRAMHFGLGSSDLVPTSAGAVSVRVEPFFAARAGGIAARGRF